MNKTVTINLAGLVFNIEEDAYELLKNYISDIKRHFQNEEGHDEIVADIESRLAELLKSKTNANKQVLIMADVNEAIGIMGKPEDFADAGTSAKAKEEPGSQSNQSYYGNKRRRVFRDGENKILGGVCSGIASYFDIDPLWIRLGLVAMFFGFGSGLLLYIVLWIIIPEAKTTAEKLEMRGEPVDVNTISKTIKDEAGHIKNRMKDYGKDMKNEFSKHKDNTGRFANFLHELFHGIFSVLAKLVGFIFVLVGILIFIGLLAVLLGFGKIDSLSTGEFIHTFGGPGFSSFGLKFAFILAIGVPFCMLVYKGMKMILGIKFHNRWLNMSAGILWILGIALLTYYGLRLGNEFSEESQLKQQVETRWPTKDTLIVSSRSNYIKTENVVDFNVNNNQWLIQSKDKRLVWWGRPKVKVIASENDSLYVFILKSAHGSEKNIASQRARNINYNMAQQDSLLLLDSYFSFEGKDIFRAQDVEVLIKMPRNKVIYLDRSLNDLCYDIDNTNGIEDDEMGGRYWKMTENGLTCTGCPKNIHDNHDKNFESKDAKVKIDANGIEVRSKDAEVKISTDGINIETKEKGEKD